jgi:cytidine deaminase
MAKVDKEILSKLIKTATEYQQRSSQLPERQVGAVVWADGMISGAFNVQYGLSVSYAAEEIALLKAITDGRIRFDALVVSVSTASDYKISLTALEILSHYNPKATVIISGENGDVVELSIEGLFP